MTSVLTLEQGARLVKLARSSIARQLGVFVPGNQEELDDPLLRQACGCFVTLKRSGRLRGCIGNLEPAGPLAEAVAHNAVSAALHDYRFQPLTAEELDKIHIDVSVLTSAVPLEYRDAADLLTKLCPGRDGVILQMGDRRATFLPQVWEQLPNPEHFLEHLCLKAGLEKTAWRTNHPQIFVYQAVSFAE